MTGLVVLGAGGHAKVAADVARLNGYEVTAFVDESSPSGGRQHAGAAVVGAIEDAPPHPVALGIGDNRARWRRYTALRAQGRDVVALVHPSAVVADGVQVGDGTLVAAGVVVNSDARIGAAVVLNTACSVDHDCTVGDAAHLAPGSRLAGAVTVGSGALIGIGACVVPGRRLGDWCVCGAGAVVVDDVAAGATVMGVPAR